MSIADDIKNRIFTCVDEDCFQSLAFEIFRYQYEENQLYRRFSDLLGRTPDSVANISDIPFMPVEFFRNHRVISGEYVSDGIVFRSSGTTGSLTSQHFVSDAALYEQSFLSCFHQFFGDVSDYHILALLPGYLERPDSSLVFMCKRLIELSKQGYSGFYLDDFDGLKANLLDLQKTGEPVILIGVSFALMDFAATHSLHFPSLRVVETGGMKGRRRELVREELHKAIRKGFGIREVASEYGMTELLSQAWSLSDGRFRVPPWMKVMIRDVNDPFTYMSEGRSGGINIIDLANIHSCSFIATQDLGSFNKDQTFNVLGRFDHSDLRGCNLMAGN